MSHVCSARSSTLYVPSLEMLARSLSRTSSHTSESAIHQGRSRNFITEKGGALCQAIALVNIPCSPVASLVPLQTQAKPIPTWQ